MQQDEAITSEKLVILIPVIGANQRQFLPLKLTITPLLYQA